MIEGKRILAVIPARGGSKGVPRKNIREVAGKPLIAWTILEAGKSKYIDRLVLSSEDAEIMEVARAWGCEVPFARPAELALDETPGIDPVIHVLTALPGYDYIVLLQPTSPVRSVEDIDGCIERCVLEGAPACVSVTEPDKSPFWMFTLDKGNRLKPLISSQGERARRQDLPQVFALNGAVYVAECKNLVQTRSFIMEDTVAYQMPKDRSWDIDTELELEICAFILQKRMHDTGK